MRTRALSRRPTLLESSLSLMFRMLPVKHGAHRLLDRFSPRAWEKGLSVVAVPYHGHTVQIDVSDLVGWHFLVMRSFDPEISEVLLSFASDKDDDVFWDIGANKGALSYAMAISLPGCRVVAVEPQSAMSCPLKANLETLAPGRHELFQVAIGEEPGRLELVIPHTNRGHASLIAAKEPGSLVEHVDVVTADTVRRRSRHGWPSLVKVDVEGFEPTVIRSLRPAFRGWHIRACVFECWASQQAGFRQIRLATETCGYRLYAITKTPFATRLRPTQQLVHGATDYALVREDLLPRSAGTQPITDAGASTRQVRIGG